MCAEDVNLRAGVPEEGTDPPGDDLERALSRGAVGLPVVVRDDEEEVVGVGGDVRLPQILQVVVTSTSAMIPAGAEAGRRSSVTPASRTRAGLPALN